MPSGAPGPTTVEDLPPRRRRGLGLAVLAIRRTGLATTSGLLAGTASAAFLAALDRATDTRTDHPGIVWALPLAGLAVAFAYHRHGGDANRGSGLLIDEIHQPRAWIPRRMAPMVGIGSVVSHLFGASVGREGAALQMSGSLTDLVARRLRLPGGERRILLVAALAGGFGGMFGVPLAGAVFGIEVQAVRPTGAELLRRARRVTTQEELRGRAGDALARWSSFAPMIWPSLVASFVADAVVRKLVEHDRAVTALHSHLDVDLFGRVALVGVACGLASLAFVGATDSVRHFTRRFVTSPPLRAVAGGVAVLALMSVFGRQYLGLSLGLGEEALAGQDTSLWVPLLKIAFTAVCLGTGYVGGEVTPLFVVGATTGAATAPLIGLDPLIGAAVGFVAVFAAAASTPVACAVMAGEIFGWGLSLPAAVACLAALSCSSHRGIYPTQRVVTAEGTVLRSDLGIGRSPQRS